MQWPPNLAKTLMSGTIMDSKVISITEEITIHCTLGEMREPLVICSLWIFQFINALYSNHCTLFNVNKIKCIHCTAGGVEEVREPLKNITLLFIRTWRCYVQIYSLHCSSALLYTQLGHVYSLPPTILFIRMLRCHVDCTVY